jgi:hypothetical protein
LWVLFATGVKEVEVGTDGALAGRHGRGRRGREEEKDEELEMEGRRRSMSDGGRDGERSGRGDGSNQPKVEEAGPVVCSLQHVAALA